MILYTLLSSPSFFKKGMGILQLPQPVRPSRYLLLNHWTKSNQIWCVSCSHEWGAGRGQKVKYHLITITKSISQICKPNFVSSHTQIKDIKHIKRDFHLVTWAMHAWGVGGSIFFFFEIQPDLLCKLLT